MSNPTQTTTRTVRTSRIAAQRDVQKALRRAPLTREEELVLRMRYGVPESPKAPLEFRGDGDPEIVTKLAMMEAATLDRMRPRPVSDAPLEGEAQAVLDRLRRM